MRREQNNTNLDPKSNSDQEDVSTVTGLKTATSTSTNTIDIFAAYNNMKRMMLGMENLIKQHSLRACNNSGNKVRDQPLSTVNLPSVERVGQT